MLEEVVAAFDWLIAVEDQDKEKEKLAKKRFKDELYELMKLTK